MKVNNQITDDDIRKWLSEPIKYQISQSYARPVYQPTMIDLHGETIQISYEKVNSFISVHHSLKTKKILIITGRSGIIIKEFPDWMKINNKVDRIELNPNKGSWTVYLKLN